MQFVSPESVLPLAAFESARQLRGYIGTEPVAAGLAEQLVGIADELCWEVGLTDRIEQDGPADGLPRLDHIGIVVVDLAVAAAPYLTLLEGQVVAGGDAVDEGIRTLHVRFPGGGKVELMQPIGPGSARTFLDRRGPGVHHVTFTGLDVERVVADAVVSDVATSGTDLTAPYMSQTFLSPRSMSGTAVQVVDQADHYGVVVGLTIDDVVKGLWKWSAGRPVRSDQSS